ncbi:uncharacterized protein BDZ99DRAFT_516665 [Mytilinidion resinicola]|uniref:Peptidase S54 rhomboid domain-containing protein n=1 Tax=Mytilinidion resinicola TaxID=574789 RepID=A0A6A6Z015_9PEZI|nr:uncharacterized protein BDZ99DRAFT_516665 [Mytilinidion resinicola]KAF2814043.1 hypothetical protein BDZ99DRAFT_516665 [Mytilinidion resinicola]
MDRHFYYSSLASNRMGGFNPRPGMGFIWGLIGANVAVFAAVHASPSQSRKLTRELPMSLQSIREGKYWTIITSGFTHFSGYHLLGNMFTLHAFGRVLVYGARLPLLNLIILSVGSLISGSAFFLAHEKRRERPYRMVQGIGASGMVMGLGAAAACLVPRTMMLVAFFPAPLWLVVSGYFAYDYWYLNQHTGTAHSGHLGGLGFGLLYYVLSLRRFGGVLGLRVIKPQNWRGVR